MKKTRFYKLFNPFLSFVFLLGAWALILASCGGGGGGTSPPVMSATGVWDSSPWDNAAWGP